jgi:hypothetical protein
LLYIPLAGIGFGMVAGHRNGLYLLVLWSG